VCLRGYGTESRLFEVDRATPIDDHAKAVDVGAKPGLSCIDGTSLDSIKVLASISPG
jgi:hypothetical protein